MKKIILISSLLVSFNTFAKVNCVDSAYRLAKMNLDQKATTMGEDAADTETDPVAISNASTTEKRTSYQFRGYILNKDYVVTVVVDSSCGVNSVNIELAQH